MHHHGRVTTMVRACSVSSIRVYSFEVHLLHVGERWRANPGQNYRKQHKAIQKTQHAHNREHGEVVKPESMIPGNEKKKYNHSNTSFTNCRQLDILMNISLHFMFTTMSSLLDNQTGYFLKLDCYEKN